MKSQIVQDMTRKCHTKIIDFKKNIWYMLSKLTKHRGGQNFEKQFENIGNVAHYWDYFYSVSN